MGTTLPFLINSLASVPVKKKSTSGSLPVWKSALTWAFHCSFEVADSSTTSVARGRFVTRHRFFIIGAVAVVAAVGRHDADLNRLCFGAEEPVLPPTDAEAGALEPEPPQAATWKRRGTAQRMIAEWSFFHVFKPPIFWGHVRRSQHRPNASLCPIMLYQFAQN